MTKDEALKILKECRENEFKYTFYTLGDYHTALDMAIKALEQAPSNPEKDRKESQDYCAECDHIEMCAWPAVGGDMSIEEITGILYKVADSLRAYDRIMAQHNCNDCRRGCGHEPQWGDQGRINCPLWKPEEDKQIDRNETI